MKATVMERNALRAIFVNFIGLGGLFASLIWFASEIESLPFFIDRSLSFLSSLWIASTALATFTLHLFRNGWFSRFGKGALRVLNAIKGKFITVLALYLLGLLLCEIFGIAPAMELWPGLTPPVISFFATYSSIAVLLVLAARYILKLSNEIDDSSTKTSSQSLIYRRLRRTALALVIPLNFVGLFLTYWLGLAPPFSSIDQLSENAVRILLTYIGAALFFPIVVFASIAVLFAIVYSMYALIKWISNSERWRMFWGKKLEPAELEAQLTTEREKWDELRRQRIDSRIAARQDRIVERNRELSAFGSVMAKLLSWTPYITFIAQAASFAFSFLGIRLYLELRQANEKLFDLNIPTFRFFESEPWITIPIMMNDLLAAVLSFLMAVIIWGLSIAAVEKVKRQEKVPIRIFLLTILLGLGSTYTAYIMWNGELSTRAEMQTAIRELEEQLNSIAQLDNNALVTVSRETQNLKVQLDRERENNLILTARKYQSQLRSELEKLRQNDASLQRIGQFIDQSQNFFEDYVTCETDGSCGSRLRGRGEVVKELEDTLRIFKSNKNVWEQLKVSRSEVLALAEIESRNAAKLLAQGNVEDSLSRLGQMRAYMIQASGISPDLILSALRESLDLPLSEDAPLEQQRDALKVLQGGVSERLEIISDFKENWRAREIELPTPLRLENVGRELSEDSILLAQVTNELNADLMLRDNQRNSIHNDIAALVLTIDINANEDSLISESDEIYRGIGSLRDKVNLLNNVNTGPTLSKLDLLQSEPGRNASRFNVVNESLSALSEFDPTPLSWAILKYAYLSVVPLLVQLMLDFGYTLVIIFAVSGLKPKESVSGI